MLGRRRRLCPQHHHLVSILARRRVCLSTEGKEVSSVTAATTAPATAVTTTTTTTTTATTHGAVAATTTTRMIELQQLERHGPGDGCLTLNVGGTEFYTLRSTVQSNAVLALHVARAEANREILKDGAVFIDRDPKHFGLILSYLRNTVENLDATRLDAQTAYVSMAQTMSALQLPKDTASISEVYVEAAFYDIGPLKKKMLSQSYLANIIGFFSKNGGENPFEAAATLAFRLRTIVLALGATGGTIFVSLQDDYEWLARKVGLKKGSSNHTDNSNDNTADQQWPAGDKENTRVPAVA